MGSNSGTRVRWAAFGAACAVALGAGGFGVVSAVVQNGVSSGERSAYVSITPVRLLDTRSTVEIQNSTRRLVIEGVVTTADGSSRQVIPSEATAVALNITVTGTRKNGDYGFVTAYPCTTESDPPPNASSLNFENGVDIANGLNVTTSGNGSICFYVYGTADLIVDVAGYFVDHDHDDRYYTETEIDSALSSRIMSSELKAVPIVQNIVNLDASVIGRQPSIALGADGNPVIAFLDVTNTALKFASCHSDSCDSASVVTIDNTGDTGYSSSVAVRANGFPIIAYYDGTGDDLRVAACNDPSCGTTTRTLLDSTGDTGEGASIAIGENGNPIISYKDVTNGDLRVAACNNSNCTSANATTIDNTGNTGGFSSIVIGTNSNPIISYHDSTNGDLRVAACNNPTCSSATLSTIDSVGNTGYYSSIDIGIDGHPVIAYYNLTDGDLRVAACNDSTCSSANLNIVDSVGQTGLDSSLTIAASGNPVISYRRNDLADLKIATCDDPNCETSSTVTMDGATPTGLETAVVARSDGASIHVAYFESSSGYLRLANIRLVATFA